MSIPFQSTTPRSRWTASDWITMAANPKVIGHPLLLLPARLKEIHQDLPSHQSFCFYPCGLWLGISGPGLYSVCWNRSLNFFCIKT
jgi:hypothetical protein